MTALIHPLLLLLAGLFFLSTAYYYFLAAASFWPEKKRSRREGERVPATRFAIVIPAHNEAGVIERTLESLKRLDYPGPLHRVYVIADNCTDETAAAARRAGVVCWERRDAVHRGKGHVLRWAFDRLLREEDPDAYVVIDADTLMDPQFLRKMGLRIDRGAKAVQGYYDVLHPERSPMGSLSYLGFVLSRHLRYKGRTRLGWTTNLLGNGMCFTREVIRRFGWCATSIVEDIEYEMILHLNDVRVVFAPEARIYAEIPETFGKSKIQRGRWDLGKFEVRNRYVPQLLREGFRRRDPSYFDSALELLIPPFSLFVCLAVTGFLLFLLLDFRGIDFHFILWSAVVLGLGIYIVGGLMSARTHYRVYLNLLYAPYFILWRLWVVLQGFWTKSHRIWVKTERG